ncbi:MAG: hypothetical protein QOF65_937, partial [Thermoleophilaceae bacterium]|nr:hypothetical protein [Thermoleophilaceae bacterium]
MLVLDGGVVLRKCRFDRFLLSVVDGGFTEVDAVGCCGFLTGAAAFLSFDDESRTATRTMLAATLSTVTTAVTFSAVRAAGELRS